VKKFLFGALLLFILGVVNVVPLFAQDEAGQVINLSDFYSVTLPDDWVVSVDEQFGGYYLTSADEAITIYALEPGLVAQMTGMASVKNPAALLIALNTLLHPDQPINNTIETSLSNNNPISSWRYTTAAEGDAESRDGRLSVVQVGAAMAAFDAEAAAGELDAALAQVDTIIASLVSTAPEVPTTDSTVSASATAEPAEPCYVSVATAGTATLRVGPGPARGAVAFLPANQSFIVIGRFVADDGSVWYQLNKNEAAPQSAANEIWVAQTEVVGEGGCESVVVTDAPPVIRAGGSGVQGLNGSGTSTGGTTGGTSGGGTSGGTSGGNTSSGGTSGGSTGNSGSSGGGGQPAPAGAIIPQSGSYRFNLAGETLASCEGTDTVRIPTLEIFDNDSSMMSVPVSVSVASGGASISIDGDGFSRNDEGVYYGTFSFDDGTNGQVRLTAVSATSLTGSMTVNFSIDGTPCSATVGVSVSR
jgi:hypothetical protein